MSRTPSTLPHVDSARAVGGDAAAGPRTQDVQPLQEPAVPSWTGELPGTVRVQDGVMWVHPTSALTAPVAIALHEELVAHPELVHGMPAIWDLRGADTSEIDHAALTRVASIVDGNISKRGAARVAILVSSTATYGICRQYEQLFGSRSHEHLVTRDEQDALRFVGGEGPEAERERAP